MTSTAGHRSPVDIDPKSIDPSIHAPSDSFDVVCPPRWGLPNAASTCEDRGFQHPNIYQFSELCALPSFATR
ncbi:jg4473 [Pararge aegeria aegeria]|uniref:Jg4473 protein n=1 Tax=Pararge aegeria aegeria TaxID=348720 RepID=A0A8S4SQ35_9NEOP|nr:jg4473 [Pararge aegeria aegeria]